MRAVTAGLSAGSSRGDCAALSMFEAVRRELDRRQANPQSRQPTSPARYWCSGKSGLRTVRQSVCAAQRGTGGRRSAMGVRETGAARRGSVCAPAVGNPDFAGLHEANCTGFKSGGREGVGGDLARPILLHTHRKEAIWNLTKKGARGAGFPARCSIISPQRGRLDCISARRVRTAAFRTFGQKKTVRAAHGRLNTIRFSFRVRRNHRGTNGARRRSCNRASCPDLPRGCC